MQLTSVGTGKMFNYLILSILWQKQLFKKNFKKKVMGKLIPIPSARLSL